MKLNPLFVIFKSIILLIGGRVQFPKDRVGATITREDGQTFTVFREVVMKRKSNQPVMPEGIFQVWFHTKMPAPRTVKISYAPLFGFLGLPGFHSKLWMYNEATGEFGGIYEWDTVEDANNYDKSYAMKFSHWRSVPGKFRTTVFPQTDYQARAHHGDVVYRLAEKSGTSPRKRAIRLRYHSYSKNVRQTPLSDNFTPYVHQNHITASSV